jgi:hypothetical protein
MNGGVDLKLIAEDLPSVLAWVLNSHSHHVDIPIEETQLPYLINSMARLGFMGPTNTDSRYPIIPFAAAMIGRPFGTTSLGDNSAFPFEIDPDITSADAIMGATVEYAARMSVSKKLQIGKLFVMHDGVSAAQLDHQYSYMTTEISGLSFSAAVGGSNQLQFVATLAGVGENIEFHYRVIPGIYDDSK